MRLATYRTPLQRVGFQVLMEATPEDMGLNVGPRYAPEQVSVFSWEGQSQEAPFADQQIAICQPHFIPGALGEYHAVRFSGEEQFLHVRNLGADRGPHYFMFVANVLGSGGFLLDACGVAVVPAEGIPKGWRFIEALVETETGITGSVALGSSYTGEDEFAAFEVACWGYRQGIPTQDERDAMFGQVLNSLGVKDRHEVSTVLRYSDVQAKRTRDQHPIGVPRQLQAGSEKLQPTKTRGRQLDPDAG